MELKDVIKDLERIFPIVNDISEDAANTLMTSIKYLEQIPTNKLSVKELIDAIQHNPDFLGDIIMAAGPSALVKALLNLQGIVDDISIKSSKIPDLGKYSLTRLRELEKQLEDRGDDPMSQYILDGLRKHIRRRKGETE